MGRAIPHAVCLLCACAVLPAGAAEITVNAERDGEALVIEAHAEFEGTLAGTWQVLTDYDNLASFIPTLTSSRIAARSAGAVTVTQKGEARLLFFSYPIEVRLVITERPMTRVDSRAVAGSFREMSGTYTVEARGGRIRLRYTGRMVPDFFVPPVIGTWVLRNNVRATFSALVEEIVRREAGALPRAPEPR